MDAAPAGCAVPTINPAAMQTAAVPATLTASVQLSSDCVWTARTSDSWIAITVVGRGTGALDLNIVQNATPQRRTGTVAMNGKALTITQDAPPCVLDVSPMPVTVPAGGGDVPLRISGSGCAFAPSTGASWTTLLGQIVGVTPATVTLRVATNPGPRRTANVTLGYHTVVVTQPAACEYILDKSSLQFDRSGGLESVLVTVASECGWTASLGQLSLGQPPSAAPGESIFAQSRTAVRTGKYR